MAVQPVLGAEKFWNRTNFGACLPPALPQGALSVHSLPQGAVDVDPLTYEVVRYRIWAITDEMGDVLKRMSGSVVVTDSNDFGVAIMDEMGDEIQVGLYNTELTATMDMVVKWTLEHRVKSPGINEGDMFLCNDPWVGGGLHQNDVSLFAPVFSEGRLFCWVCAVAHQVDLGGLSPGSWSVNATDVFAESVPIPPIKIVEAGRLREDIEDAYLRRSRIPRLVALDLRAKMGALSVARERILGLVGHYGADTVKAVMKKVMDDAEARLRRKLASLPDGEWQSTAYQDQARAGDRGVYAIRLTLSKENDHLTFDFRGTDAQVDGPINCTYGGMRGGVVPAVLALLCQDIPWAVGGIGRCLEIRSVPGSLNDCEFPAAISKASVASGWATVSAVHEVLAAMLDIRLPDRVGAVDVMSVCKGTFALTLLAGLDQREHPFVTMLSDAMAGGFGATPERDGVDTGGEIMIPMGRIADVERNELAFPMLYLWRRQEADTGGPGRHRGGLGVSSCFVVHDSKAPVRVVVSASGKALPQASGLSGAYPGSGQYDAVIRESNLNEVFSSGSIPGSLDAIKGRTEVLQPHGELELHQDDVYFTQIQGGGGYGDPLARSPQLVARDVREGKVSREAGERVYGVVLGDSGIVDDGATSRQRESIREARLRAAGLSKGGHRSGAEVVGVEIDDNLVLRDEDVRCRRCGYDIGSTGDSLDHAARLRRGIESRDVSIPYSPRFYVDSRIELRQAICPGCGTLLLTELVPENEKVTRRARLERTST